MDKNQDPGSGINIPDPQHRYKWWLTWKDDESWAVDLLVVELEVHAVVYLVVLQPDVVLEDGVPLLQHDLVPPNETKNNYKVKTVLVLYDVIWVSWPSGGGSNITSMYPIYVLPSPSLPTVGMKGWSLKMVYHFFNTILSHLMKRGNSYPSKINSDADLYWAFFWGGRGGGLTHFFIFERQIARRPNMSTQKRKKWRNLMFEELSVGQEISPGELRFFGEFKKT
jgi:hypothetical protein